MNKYLALVYSFLVFSIACQTPISESTSKKNEYHLIPLPAELIPQQGQFTINQQTVIITDKNLAAIAEGFSKKLKAVSGFDLKIKTKGAEKNAIIFQLDKQQTEAEGYTLSVNADRVLAKALTPKGLFYAWQTIRQLLPNEFEDNQLHKNLALSIPAVEITDFPRFQYRGAHLDVARHFFDVEAVKGYIDQLAYHKLNYFHWHLTEDQGWRIEIKKYPKLTEVAAFRAATLVGHYNDQPHQFDGQRYGGFYTQEEVKEIVQYAADRFITVIPEIEMPGHAQAAIAAYPELGCTGEQLKVLQIWGVSDNVYCPREATFDFLENVLAEVIPLFPGKYIHIGGDECPKTQWEESAFCQQLIHENNLKDEHGLQSYFIQRIEKFINAQGKRMIGWDEILEGGLAPNATVMSWRGISGGIEAAQAGHDVVMTPTSHCYFDYYQSDHPEEPLAIGGLLPLEKVYSYEPIPEELSAADAKYILGAQANLWTEYIPTIEQLHYMAFPRLSALSEVVWSPKASRDFADFIPRVSTHITRQKLMGVQAANHLYELASTIQAQDGKIAVQLSTLAPDAEIRYTLDGSEPTASAQRYEIPIQIDSDRQIKACSFLNGEKKGRGWAQTITLHKAAGKNIELLHLPSPKYSGGGSGSVINGVLGSNERYGDAEWLGFNGQDFTALIEMEKTDTLHEITCRFFKGEGQWIYLPKSLSIQASDDGKNFEEIAATENIAGDSKVVEVSLPLADVRMRFLKVIVENFGDIPAGRQGAGNKAWLFVDEVVVR